MAIDWPTVFDEVVPRRGATEAAVKRFVAAVGRPMSPAEIRRVNAEQRNPFPKTDPLYPVWRPFDPAAWVISNRPLPPSYLALLRWSNGGAFRTGERWFQLFDTATVRDMLLAYNLPQYMAHALPIAFNGGGVFYALDMRKAAVRGEYPVVCSHAGNLGWDRDECAKVAASFPAACRGTVNVEELL